MRSLATKFILFGLFICFGFFLINQFSNSEKSTKKDSEKTAYNSFAAGLSIKAKKDKFARFTYEKNKLVDPKTGKVPTHIRGKELAFAKTLISNSKAAAADSLEWISRGPKNIGGRTRAFGIDVANDNIMLAGGVSGGIWRTENGGQDWYKVSSNDEHQGVTSLAQDTRPGHTNTWYYGTGEGYGNSAGDGGAYYFGNGMYKSIDNGLTWDALGNTNSNTLTVFDDNFDIIWRVATDPSNQDQDEVYVATYSRLYRSVDGGETFTSELGSSLTPSYFVDVAVTSTGVVYVTLSSDGGTDGIFRSVDGMTYTEITPDGFADEFERIVIGINPSDEDEVYFLAHTPGFGKETFDFRNEGEWNSLWKYRYLSGDGTDELGEWADLSQNLPIGPYKFDDFVAQGGYDLVIAVKPDDPNTVFIGGTNLYRSTDGFTSMDNTTFMGGYGETTDLPLFELYPNHHPDQHGLAFLPSNPDILVSTHDGGITKTADCMAPVVEWENLNNGYVTTQFYTIAIDQSTTSNVIIGGLQDNGTRYMDVNDPDKAWTMPFNYDGAFCGIPAGKDYYYMSVQLGRIVKIKVNEEGLLDEYQRIDPADVDDPNYLFINPFVMDPNDNDIIYMAEGKNLWANIDLSVIPWENNFDSTAINWVKNVNPLPGTNEVITALTATKIPTNRVYIGSSAGKVYKVDEALNSTSELVDISDPLFPDDGYASCVASDPRNGNRIFVVFSNYGVYSLFCSLDGGASWERCAGNLEQNSTGFGNGPSLRWLSVLPKANFNDADFYLGTSVGLYHTNLIDGTDTEWEHIAVDEIGTTVVEMIETRELDGLIAVATHGNGVFTANTPDDPEVGIENANSIEFDETIINIGTYPNPASSNSTLNFELTQAAEVKVQLIDELGRVMRTSQLGKLPKGQHQHLWDLSKVAEGIYYTSIETQDFKSVKSIIKFN